MKARKRILSVVMALVMVVSLVVFPITVHAEEVAAQFGDAWVNYSNALSATPSVFLETSFYVPGETKFMLHSDAPFDYSLMHCACGAGTECETLNGVTVDALKIRYDENGEMLDLTFANEEKEWGGEVHSVVYGTAIPTASAKPGSVVTGAFWYEIDEHKSGEFPFKFALLDGGVSNAVVSTDLSIAETGMGGQGTIPTLKLEMTADQEVSVALCTTYWTGENYSATPTALEIAYTAGNDLLNMSAVNTTHDEIWGGADCTFMVITPSATGKVVAEDTVVTGTVTALNSSGQKVEIPFEITLKAAAAKGAGNSVVSTDLSIAETGMGGQGTIPTLKLEMTADQEVSVALCTTYWTGENYSATPKPLEVTCTAGEGLLNMTAVNTGHDEIWDAADCTFLVITPSAAGRAAADGTAVTGSVAALNGSGEKVEIPFEITLNAASGDAGVAEPVVLEPVVSGDVSIANASLGASGDIPTMNIGFNVAQELSVALCTTYWTDTKYSATPTPLEINFTSGKDLVAMSVVNTAHDEVWAGADCTYLVITPTAAGQAISESVQVSGSIKIFSAASGSDVEIPFDFTLSTIPTFQEWGVADAWTSRAQEIISQANPAPISTVFFGLKDQTENFKALLHTSRHGMICTCGSAECEELNNAENLKIRVDEGADLMNVEFSMEYDATKIQDCVYITLTPTELARTNVKSGPISMAGAMWYESADGAHKTGEYEFAFTFQEKAMANDREKLPTDVDAVVNAHRLGNETDPVKVVVDPTMTYRGKVMTKGLMPFVVCEMCGVDNCPESSNFGAEYATITFSENAQYIESVRFELTTYDGWGPCLFMFLDFTEAAVSADPGTRITGTFAFQKDDHKTKGIDIDFYLYEGVLEEGGIRDVEDETQPNTPNEPGENNSKLPLIIGLGAGAVLLVAVLVVLIIRKKKKA